MNYLNLGKNLSSLQLIDFVSEVVSGSIRLDRQLQLCHYLIVNHNLQGDITDRNFISESIFDLFYCKSRVRRNIFLNLVYSLNDVGNL